MAKKEVTGAQRKRMRELHALGVPVLKIAREFGLNKETVYRHLDPRWEAKIREYQRKRYERERQNPVVVERRRATARKYAAKKREEYEASGVKTGTRRDKKVTPRGNQDAE